MSIDFPKVFVINLNRSVARRKLIENKLNHYNIPFEIFSAIDGSELSVEDFVRIRTNAGFFKKKYGREMNEGEIGCALSHINLYKKIVLDKTSHAIILEDDIEFDARLKHLVSNNVKIIDLLKHFDLVLLGYAEADLNYRRGGKCSVWKRIVLDEIIKVGVPVNRCWGTIGYLISQEGARKLLLNGDIPQMQADFLTSNSPSLGVKLGLIKNQLVWPNELVVESIIGTRIFDESKSSDSLSVIGRKSLTKRTLLKIDKFVPVKTVYYLFRKRIIALKLKFKSRWAIVNPKQYTYVEKF
jgi:glycosyl transferase family 25